MRNALFTSIISMLLCVSMLVGTTFAWFTDSVVSANNIIKSGNLDIVLEYWDGDSWKDVQGKSDILSEDLWEPGYVDVAYLRLKNAGSLALKYQLGVNIVTEKPGVNQAGAEFKLSDYIYFDVIEGVDGETNPYANRAAALAVATQKTKISAGYSKAGALEAGSEDLYLALVVHMPTTVGNEANHNGKDIPQIDLGINAYATQLMSEDDSFGKDYDKDAWVDGFDVFTAQDLQAAINNGETAIDLMANIEATESIVIPEGATVALNLNGKDLGYKDGYAIESKGDLTISGEGDITGMGGIRATAGKLTINGGNYYGASDWSKGTYQHAIKAENATVVINGGDFDATVNGQTNAMLNASANATITINGGNFQNVEGELPKFAPYIATYEKNGMIVINDGTFYGGWRFNGETSSTEINGGTFTVGFDGQSFHANSTHNVNVFGGTFVSAANAKLTDKVKSGEIVAAGYKAVDNGDGTYSVIFPQESFDSLIDNAGENATIEVPAGNFKLPTMAEKEGVTIVGAADGSTLIGGENASTGFGGNFGKGNTYKNLTFTGTSNGVRSSYANGGTTTFENCTFAGDSTYGFHIDESKGATFIFNNCTFSGFNAFAGDLVKVTFNNCTFLSNGNYGHTNIWSVGEFNNCTWREGATYGTRGDGVIYIDGAAYVTDADSLATAVANGETNILLADGEYDVKNCGGKTLTISGSKNAVLKLYNEGEDGCDYGFGGPEGVGNVTFNGLTIDTTANTGNYKGYAYMKGTFNDCNFVGAYSLNNHNDFVFNRCTFDFKNGYFWTWGAKSVSFDGCIFNGNSKTILAHGSAATVININDCTFAATEKGYTGAGDNTAVVEMDPISSNTYTINFTGENTKTEHYAGWTRVKDGTTGHIVNGLN